MGISVQSIMGGSFQQSEFFGYADSKRAKNI